MATGEPGVEADDLQAFSVQNLRLIRAPELPLAISNLTQTLSVGPPALHPAFSKDVLQLQELLYRLLRTLLSEGVDLPETLKRRDQFQD